jgi:hypothetical protein
MKHIPLLLFILALSYSFWGFANGFSHSLYDEHSFRQTQTALTAYFFTQGSSFFSYETPLLGPPWKIPFELPLYQYLVAKLYQITSLTLEESGRIIGRLFFLLALVPLYFGFRSMGISKNTRYIGLSIYLLSPLYLFWSRTFLIESTALFFALSYFALFISKSQNSALLVLLALSGSLAGTLKVTTAFTFFVLAGLIFLSWIRKEDKFFLGKKLLFGFVIPGILSLIWIRYTDEMKGLSPLAEFIRSKELETWNFGTLKQRLSWDLWYMFFRKTLHDSIGHRTTFLISLAFLYFLPKKNRAYAILSLFAFLLAPLTFTNLHIEHTYYWYANGIFLVAYLTLVLDGLEKSKLPQKKLITGFLVLIALSLSVREYYRSFYQVQKRNETGLAQEFDKLRAQVPEEDVLVVLGGDWYPALAWEAKRRTIMVRDNPGISSEKFRESLEMLKAEGRKVGAVLNCDGSRANFAKDQEEARKLFPLPHKPDFSGACATYLVKP